MAYTLTRQASDTVQMAQQTAWAVRLVVTSADPVNYPPKVFVFQAEDPSDVNTKAWFTAVASPSQLEEYPEDAPAGVVEGVQQPYFRLSELTLISRNADDIEKLVDQVFKQLTMLSKNLEALRRLSSEEVIIGPVTPYQQIIRGLTWSFSLLVRDSPDGPTSDLDGYTASSQIRDADNNLVIDLAPTIDGSYIRMSLTREQTEALALGTFQWSVVLTDPQDNDEVILAPEPIQVVDNPTVP